MKRAVRMLVLMLGLASTYMVAAVPRIPSGCRPHSNVSAEETKLRHVEQNGKVTKVHIVSPLASQVRDCGLITRER